MPQSVNFFSQGLKIAANLYLPQDASQKERAALVVSHPGGGCKEQTAGLYAEKLRQLGFIALTFDAAYQGASEGQPRYLEDPSQRAEDIKNAVTYLSTLPEVDPERIGALGICASGAYVSFAAQTDVRIKAAAGISSACFGRLFSEGLHNSNPPEALQQALVEAGKERIREANEIIDTLPDRTLFKEAYDYYCTPRAQQAGAPNRFLFRSMDKLAQFSGFENIHMVSPRPVLLIVGSDADSKYFSENAIEKAKEPKELFVIEGATHIDLYDRPQYVDPAVKKLESFFNQYLVDA